MSKIIAIANQKGGVAKTTTTLALGTCLADYGQRVLLVDLDPQASLTSAAGRDSLELAETIYPPMVHYIRDSGQVPLDPYLHEIGPRRDLLPASIELAMAEVDLLNAVRREYILARVLRPVRDRYDVILIDCPPSLSLLTINALTAADEVLIPVLPEYLAARGLRLLLTTIERVRSSELNADLAIAGVILTMVDNRTTHSRMIVESVRANLADQVPILGEVKRTIKASEAAYAGVSVTHYAAGSETAQAYGQIARALLAAWGVEAAPAPAQVEVAHG